MAQFSSVRWLLAAAAVTVSAGLAIMLALDRVATPARAQPGAVEVTASQLLINQRISQAGVRRSNQALRLLAPLLPEKGQPHGWPTAAIRDGAVTGAKLAASAVTEDQVALNAIGPSRLTPAVREMLQGPAFAVVEADGRTRVAPDGATRIARGVVATQRIGVGSYGVTFEKGHLCSVSASVEAGFPATPDRATVGGPWLGPIGDPALGGPSYPAPVAIHTFGSDGAPADRAFHVIRVC